jgi:four helix bundle protein
MPIERFEDLVAWQKARVLTRDIYAMTRLPSFSRDFVLRDQICRASISVMSNIAEGFERYGPGEFQHFLSIAKGSCGEVRSQLYIALDAGHIGDQLFTQRRAAAEEVGRVLGGLRSAVDQQKRG